jgi:hypothetical protein
MKKKSPYQIDQVKQDFIFSFDFASLYPSVTPKLHNKFVRIIKMKKIWKTLEE